MKVVVGDTHMDVVIYIKNLPPNGRHCGYERFDRPKSWYDIILERNEPSRFYPKGLGLPVPKRDKSQQGPPAGYHTRAVSFQIWGVEKFHLIVDDTVVEGFKLFEPWTRTCPQKTKAEIKVHVVVDGQEFVVAPTYKHGLLTVWQVAEKAAAQKAAAKKEKEAAAKKAWAEKVAAEKAANKWLVAAEKAEGKRMREEQMAAEAPYVVPENSLLRQRLPSGNEPVAAAAETAAAETAAGMQEEQIAEKMLDDDMAAGMLLDDDMAAGMQKEQIAEKFLDDEQLYQTMVQMKKESPDCVLPFWADLRWRQEQSAAEQAAAKEAAAKKRVDMFERMQEERFLAAAKERRDKRERAQEEQIARALASYEVFYALPTGTATVDQVSSSAAGIQGWATAALSSGNEPDAAAEEQINAPYVVPENSLLRQQRPSGNEPDAAADMKD